jgi:Tfp pilus assembly protein PilW
MNTERGIGIVEVLVTTLAASIIFLGLAFFYMGATRAVAGAASQSSLQRQATLALQEIAHRVRSGVGPDAITSGCQGQSNAVQVKTADGTFCFYAGAAGTADAGKLCEYQAEAGAGCRDLLYGALQPRVSAMELLVQPAVPDPACPHDTAPGAACFSAAALDPSTADVSFAVTDGLSVMSVAITASCKGRDSSC